MEIYGGFMKVWEHMGKDKLPVIYEGLVGDDGGIGEDRGVPKGYVPMLVGGVGEEEAAERFLVHTRLFKHPRIIVLLEMAAQEFGYEQQGVLKIPCEIEHFWRVIDVVSKAV